jgi:hypothetical protein
MSITKLAPVGNWAQVQQPKNSSRDLAHVTAGRSPRIIVGMLTGGNSDLFYGRSVTVTNR